MTMEGFRGGKLHRLLLSGLCLVFLFSTSLAQDWRYAIKELDSLDDPKSPVNFIIREGSTSIESTSYFPGLLQEKYDPENNYKYPGKLTSLSTDFLGYDIPWKKGKSPKRYWYDLYAIFTSVLACLTSDESASNLQKYASKGNFWFHEPAASLEPHFITARENIRMGLMGPGLCTIEDMDDKIQYLPSRKTLEKISDLLYRMDRYVKWVAENNLDLAPYMKCELDKYRALSIEPEEPPPGWEKEIHKELLEVIWNEVEKFGDKINESYAFGGVDTGKFVDAPVSKAIYGPLHYEIDKIRKKLVELGIGGATDS